MIYSTVSRDAGLTFEQNIRLSLAASNDNGARSGGDYSGFAYYGGRLYFFPGR